LCLIEHSYDYPVGLLGKVVDDAKKSELCQKGKKQRKQERVFERRKKNPTNPK
tara:strand:+ start:2044 stop:2202 length:159 start_codon:yes stop_codon:yes gene_type:complete